MPVPSALLGASLGCVEGAEIGGTRALSETEGFVMVGLPIFLPMPVLSEVEGTDNGELTTEFLLFITLVLPMAGICLPKLG